LGSGFVYDLSVDEHEPSGDGALGLSARLKEPARHKQKIETLFRHALVF
jgi:hypothetical protein